MGCKEQALRVNMERHSATQHAKLDMRNLIVTQQSAVVQLEQDQRLNNQSIGKWWWRLNNQLGDNRQ
eukprot:6655421-Ditylum_brightwellii.AAC.1